ncbi:MAG: hypothetical protein DRP01_02015 [Archaeoglobales archaeon]|nr:MAG: hypothetical protein DRP01_02015 [Archaeoglobales archaeon]
MSLRGRVDDPLGGNSLSGSVVLPATTTAQGEIQLIKQGNVRGVYALNPATTPKYHTGRSAAGAQDVSLEKMARMFIPFPAQPTSLKQKFLASLNGPAERFAKAMLTTGNKQAGGGLGYIDFFMTQANETMAESVQIAQVASDNYVSYFFGRQPPVFRYDGVLLNSVQDDWRTAMWIVYNHIIRGTQLARRKVAITLAYDTVAVTGAVLNMTEILRAENEIAVPFSFSLLVKRLDIISSPKYGPTPAQEFPYSLTPDSFASTVIAPAQVNRRAVAEPSLKTQERQGASESAGDTETDDLYNSVSPEQRAEANTLNIFDGIFGNATSIKISRIAADLNGPAS